MASEDLKINDLVWAKMKGFPPWPAKIAELQHDTKPPKKKAQYVKFFGSNDFAWILNENITPHSENFLNNVSQKKSTPYQKAIDELVNFSKSSQKNKQNSAEKEKEKMEIVPNVEEEESFSKNEKNMSGKDKEIIPETKTEIAPKKVAMIIPKSKKEKKSLGIDEETVPKEKETESESSPKKSRNNGTKSQPKVDRIVDICEKKVKGVLTSRQVRKRPIHSEVNGESSECTSPKTRKLMVNEGPHPDFDITSVPLSEDDSETTSDSSDSDDHVMPTSKRIGFIGLGNVGKAIVQNFLKSGHDVTVFNRTTYKCETSNIVGAKRAQSPSDLILSCDIIFCSVSDPEASKAIIFGDRGILKGLDQAEKLGNETKGYVEMTSIDPDTSKEIEEVITRKNCMYLEAPICGDSNDALEGTLLILASGSMDLFFQCETCFHAVGQNAYFVSSDVGYGSKMSLLFSMFSGTVYAAVAEILILAKRLNIPEKDFLAALLQGPLQCQNILEKCKRMIGRHFEAVTPLKHVQKDLNITLSLGNQVSQPMPVTAAANELYKLAKHLQYSDFDISAVYQGLHY